MVAFGVPNIMRPLIQSTLKNEDNPPYSPTPTSMITLDPPSGFAATVEGGISVLPKACCYFATMAQEAGTASDRGFDEGGPQYRPPTDYAPIPNKGF